MAAKYHVKEVRELVEGYAVLNEGRSVSKNRLWLFVRLCDLDHALADLSPLLRGIVRLHGFLGLPMALVAGLLGVDTATVSRRYGKALTALTATLNGTTEEH